MNAQFPPEPTQPIDPQRSDLPQASGPAADPLPPPQPQTPAGPSAYPQPAMPQATSYPPDNYLVWAILTTVLCCLPFGIVSIVKSSQVNTLWWQGRHGEAYAASESAKNWAIASAATSVGVMAVWLLIMVVGAFSAQA